MCFWLHGDLTYETHKNIVLLNAEYHRWDSNPHWTDFKSVVSAYWTTAAYIYYSIYIVICQVELESFLAFFAGCYKSFDVVCLGKTSGRIFAGCGIMGDGDSWGWTHVHWAAARMYIYSGLLVTYCTI